MKKLITLSLAFSALVFTATAQEQREIKKDKKVGTERREGMKGDRKGMMNDLNLTDAQKTQMKANREEFKTKMEQLKAQNLPEAQYNERKKALHAEQKAKMESILTAEQKAKMAEKRGNFEGKDKNKQGKDFGKMKEELSLTDDQSAKLKAQHQALKARMEAIKNDQSLSKEAKKEKMMALKNEAKEQRKSILTAEQMKKMEEFKKDRKDKSSRKARK